MTDSKNSAKSGRVHEVLGMYDPVNDKKEIDGDRAKYWISKGAKVSDTVHNFLITKKIIPGKKINALPRKSPIKAEVKEGEAASAPAAAPVPSATA